MRNWFGILTFVGVALAGVALVGSPAEADECCEAWKEYQPTENGYICWEIVCNPTRQLCCKIFSPD